MFYMKYCTIWSGDLDFKNRIPNNSRCILYVDIDFSESATFFSTEIIDFKEQTNFISYLEKKSMDKPTTYYVHIH